MPFFLAEVVFAQNTKGDKPARPLPGISYKSKSGKTKPISSKTRYFLGGNRSKTKTSASQGQYNSPKPNRVRRNRGDRPGEPIGGTPIKIRSTTARMARNNVYPKTNFYVHNPSKKPRKHERSFTDAPPIDKPTLYGNQPNTLPRDENQKISTYSRSHSFVIRKKKNVYWGKFSKGEKPFIKDITGRALRRKNYRSPSIGITTKKDLEKNKKWIGIKSLPEHKKIFSSNSISPSKSTQIAWNGDISGNKIRRNSSKNKKPSNDYFPKPPKFSVSRTSRNFEISFGSGKNLSLSSSESISRSFTSPNPKKGSIVPMYQKSYKQPPLGVNGASIYRSNNKPSHKRWNNITSRKYISISGKSLNNKGNPIMGDIPLVNIEKIGNFKGSLKGKHPGKRRRSVSEKLKINQATSIYQGNIKLSKYGKYIHNTSSAKEALKTFAPTQATSIYQGNIKLSKYGKYVHNPSSAKKALKTFAPTQATSIYQGNIKLSKYGKYVHNPSSAKEALKTFAPNKVYAKIVHYQGNIRMRKPYGSNSHPEAQFAYGHFVNDKNQRTNMTKIKIWWAKHFKKNDYLTPSIKEKIRKPRYDKKERELWKDLYD